MTTPPPIVARYFLALGATDWADPWVSAEYRPDTGWTRPPAHKRITRSWAAKLGREGVERVELTFGPRGRAYARLTARERGLLRRADFTPRELSRRG